MLSALVVIVVALGALGLIGWAAIYGFGAAGSLIGETVRRFREALHGDDQPD